MKALSPPNYDQDRAERLTNRLVAEPSSPGADAVMNDLLSEFHRGYPLENLRRLLHSRDGEVVKAGAWIASELGTKGHQLLPDVLPLIHHPAKSVRFSIADCILLWATDGAELSSVAELADDSETAVRWKAMDFLSRTTTNQLRTMLSYLEKVRPESTHVRGLRWLLGPEATDANQVKTVMQDENPLLRKYGVVAAARMSKINSDPLSYALSLTDPDLQNFAKSEIALLKD